jgi:RNA 2',3'-cyclic 3'-phosphodiesterase
LSGGIFYEYPIDDMALIRTFIALPASADAQQSISLVQEALKESNANIRWEDRGKFHITLKFLGETEESGIPLLAADMESAYRAFSPFDIIYKSVGAFPDLKNPRIVWIGTEHKKDIFDLQTATEQACLKHGFPAEERKFHPHITLGRVRGKQNLVHLTEAIKTSTFEPIHSRCLEVLLVKSDLRPSGSIYTIMKSFQLLK